ncbi:hypothetical protein JCM10212_004707 [Sporobolomyces blumeae]
MTNSTRRNALDATMPSGQADKATTYKRTASPTTRKDALIKRRARPSAAVPSEPTEKPMERTPTRVPIDRLPHHSTAETLEFVVKTMTLIKTTARICPTETSIKIEGEIAIAVETSKTTKTTRTAPTRPTSIRRVAQEERRGAKTARRAAGQQPRSRAGKGANVETRTTMSLIPLRCRTSKTTSETKLLWTAAVRSPPDPDRDDKRDESFTTAKGTDPDHDDAFAPRGRDKDESFDDAPNDSGPDDEKPQGGTANDDAFDGDERGRGGFDDDSRQMDTNANGFDDPGRPANDDFGNAPAREDRNDDDRLDGGTNRDNGGFDEGFGGDRMERNVDDQGQGYQDQDRGRPLDSGVQGDDYGDPDSYDGNNGQDYANDYGNSNDNYGGQQNFDNQQDYGATGRDRDGNDYRQDNASGWDEDRAGLDATGDDGDWDDNQLREGDGLDAYEEREGRPLTPLPTAAELGLSEEEYHRHITALQKQTAADLADAHERLRDDDTPENRRALEKAQRAHEAALLIGQSHHDERKEDHEAVLDDPHASPEERHEAAWARHLAAENEVDVLPTLNKRQVKVRRAHAELDRDLNSARAQREVNNAQHALKEIDRERDKKHEDLKQRHGHLLQSGASDDDVQDSQQKPLEHRLDAAQESESDAARQLEDHRSHLQSVQERHRAGDASDEELTAARRAHRDAEARFAETARRRQHLQDKHDLESLHSESTPEERLRHHDAAERLLRHHQGKHAQAKSDHAATERHLAEHPDDPDARARVDAAKKRTDKHRDRAHEAAVHLRNSRHARLLDAERHAKENPDDPRTQESLRQHRAAHDEAVQHERDARKGTDHHHRHGLAVLSHDHAAAQLERHRRHHEEVRNRHDRGLASREELDAARHAHEAAEQHHASMSVHRKHLEDKVALHLEGRNEHHFAAGRLLRHHQDKHAQARADHAAAEQHLAEHPDDPDARARVDAAKKRTDKHRDRAHEAAVHLRNSRHARLLDAERHAKENPDDPRTQESLRQHRAAHDEAVQHERDARKGTVASQIITIVTVSPSSRTTTPRLNSSDADAITRRSGIAMTAASRLGRSSTRLAMLTKRPSSITRSGHLLRETRHKAGSTKHDDLLHRHRNALRRTLESHRAKLDQRQTRVSEAHRDLRRRQERLNDLQSSERADSPELRHAQDQHRAAAEHLEALEDRHARHEVKIKQLERTKTDFERDHHDRLNRRGEGKTRDAQERKLDDRKELDRTSKAMARSHHEHKETHKNRGQDDENPDARTAADEKNLAVAHAARDETHRHLEHAKRLLRHAHAEHRALPTESSKRAIYEAQAKHNAAETVHRAAREHYKRLHSREAEESHRNRKPLSESEHAIGTPEHDAVVHNHHRSISRLLKTHEKHAASSRASVEKHAADIRHHRSILSRHESSHPEHRHAREQLKHAEREHAHHVDRLREHEDKVAEFKAEKAALEKEHRDTFERHRADKARKRKAKVEAERKRVAEEKESRRRAKEEHEQNEHEARVEARKAKEHEEEVRHRRAEAAEAKKREHDEERHRQHKEEVERARAEREKERRRRHDEEEEKHRKAQEERRRHEEAEKEMHRRKREERKKAKAEAKRVAREKAEEKAKHKAEEKEREHRKHETEKAEHERKKAEEKAEREHRKAEHEHQEAERSRSRSRSHARSRGRSHSRHR